MPAVNRKNRLESLLHQEIAVCVQQELKDPRIGFVTVVRVELTDDLQQAKAFYTVLGDQKQRRLAEQALAHARGFIQGRYADVVKTRRLPQLSFVYDDAEFRRSTMDELIHKARRSDADGGSRPEPAAPKPKPDADLPGGGRGRRPGTGADRTLRPDPPTPTDPPPT